MRAASEPLSQSIEEYLEAIHRFSAMPRGASTSRLAERLRVKPGSVTGMLRRLSGLGLIAYRRYHDIALTEEGERRAHDVVRRHRLAERLLADVLKVPLDQVHEEACRLEHAVSPELLPRLASALGSPDSCPHGHPVDAATHDDTIALTEAPPGVTVPIARLDDETPEVVRYLAERRLVPGARVTIRDMEPLGGAVEIEAAGHRYTLGYPLASSIRVSPPKRRRTS